MVGSRTDLSCLVNRGGTDNIPNVLWSGPVGSQNITGLSSMLRLNPLRATSAGTYTCHASFQSVTGSESINVIAACKMALNLIFVIIRLLCNFV